MTRHRRSHSVLAVLEDDDLVWEILLRLPPQPSSLPRASAVCKRWRHLATDPRFLSQFYMHHRKPPLLGLFEYREGIVFTPVLDPPDCIPPVRFDLVRYDGHRDDDDSDSVLRFPIENNVLGCRHGLVLVGDYLWRRFVVCDPITSEQCHVAAPFEFWGECFNGAVLCVDRDKGHVHGACHSSPSPFKVVLVSTYSEYIDNYGKPIARVYSSENNKWGGLISAEASHNKRSHIGPSTLVGNVLYWPLHNWGDNMLEFDLDTQNLAVIKGPPGTNDSGNFQIIQVEDGTVGVAVLSYHTLQLWQRKFNLRGVAKWLPHKTVALGNLLNIPRQTRRKREWLGLVGYDEDNDVILLGMSGGVYMVEPKSMQTRKLNVTCSPNYCYPFTSFFPPGCLLKW